MTHPAVAKQFCFHEASALAPNHRKQQQPSPGQRVRLSPAFPFQGAGLAASVNEKLGLWLEAVSGRCRWKINKNDVLTNAYYLFPVNDDL